QLLSHAAVAAAAVAIAVTLTASARRPGDSDPLERRAGRRSGANLPPPGAVDAPPRRPLRPITPISPRRGGAAAFGGRPGGFGEGGPGAGGFGAGGPGPGGVPPGMGRLRPGSAGGSAPMDPFASSAGPGRVPPAVGPGNAIRPGLAFPGGPG